jgi:hypothetical protein
MPLESPVLRDGDAGFIGFASRLNPLNLPPGVLQVSENMRLDRGVATTRRGARRMASGIALTDTPLTVPFNLAVSEGTNDPVVRNVYAGGVFASAVVRSPDAVNSFEVVVLASDSAAYIQIFDAGNEFSAQWGGGPILATNSPDPDEIIITAAGEDILSTLLPSSLTYPAGETVEPSDKVSFVQAFNRLYLLRAASINREGWQTKGVTSGGITVSGTTATVNLAGHGYDAGMRVRIEGSDVAAFDGVEYDITAAGADDFEITVPSGTAQDTTTTGRTVRRVKAPLYWDLEPNTNFVKNPGGIPAVGPTYKSMPSVPWAVYTNNRLVVPSGRDGVLLSDWLDPEVYDPFWASFRANQGSNDYIVAVQPWVENSFLVFMRKSIWLATVGEFGSTDGTSFDIDTPVSKLELLTDEVGCVARKTIAVAGQYVFFLSDAGVYRLDARLDLKLRGDTKPLSDPIADEFESLDQAIAERSVGIWHDNRYWLAVPETASANPRAKLYIWSALNEQWETRDEYGFGADDLLVVTNGSKRRVMVTSQAGTIMMLDEVEAGDDAPDPSIVGYVGTVPGRIVTRRYGMQSMSSKRFIRALSDVVLPSSAGIQVRAALINPDRTITLVPGQTNDSGLSEDYTLKQPIRQKAHYAELEFLTTANRPEIRTVSVEAHGPSQPPTETRNAA